MKKIGGKTEEELKFTTIYPLFNAVMDPSLVKDTWYVIAGLLYSQIYSSKPFSYIHIGERFRRLAQKT